MKWMNSIVCVALIATAYINTVQSCGVVDWVECAGIVALCAASCIDPFDGICEACMGIAFDKCVSCITLTHHINGLVTVKGTSNQTCGAASWVQCAAQLGKCEVVCEADLTGVACTSCLGRTADTCVYCLPQVAKPGLMGSDQVSLASCSPWTWIQCAAKVLDCAATCANDIKSHACTKCFGHVYDQCIGCITFDRAVRRHQDLALFDCSASSWLWCAGSLAKCTFECIDNGITSPECFNCLGSAYDDCIKCISSDMKAELKHLAIAQAISRGALKARSVDSSIGNCRQHQEHYKAAEGSLKK